MRPYPKIHKIEKFLNLSQTSLPIKFTSDSFSDSLSHGFPVIIARPATKEAESTIRKTLTLYSDLIKNYFHVYILSDLRDPEQTEVARYCQTPSSKKDSTKLCILRSRRGGRVDRYLFGKAELSSDNILRFVDSYISGKLAPYFASEKITEKFSGKIKNLNGYTISNFLTADSESDTASRVVYYYQTDCISCEQFRKLLQAAAEDSDSSVVTFGQVNVDKNEVADSAASSFPALYGYLAIPSDPIEFTGEFNEANLAEFIKKVHAARDHAISQAEEERVDL